MDKAINDFNFVQLPISDGNPFRLFLPTSKYSNIGQHNSFGNEVSLFRLRSNRTILVMIIIVGINIGSDTDDVFICGVGVISSGDTFPASLSSSSFVYVDDVVMGTTSSKELLRNRSKSAVSNSLFVREIVTRSFDPEKEDSIIVCFCCWRMISLLLDDDDDDDGVFAVFAVVVVVVVIVVIFSHISPVLSSFPERKPNIAYSVQCQRRENNR